MSGLPMKPLTILMSMVAANRIVSEIEDGLIADRPEPEPKHQPETREPKNGCSAPIHRETKAAARRRRQMTKLEGKGDE